MSKLFGIFLLVVVTKSYGQTFLLKNEEIIFSFDTKKGKHMTLAKDKSNQYIVYRFGTKDKVEFEFPEKDKNSWTKFKYSFYLRGGGVQNEGEDLNYISFTNTNFKYVIYDTYYSVRQSTELGVKVVNITTNSIIDIKGDYKTKSGRLTDFRENNLLEITNELEE